ncbi:MAG: uracil-DNA glycosylase, partial [Gammaproteobacteria bacterium]|nr:uracil-DNA glycosylase [Gammaproteobacteria bacterium]
ITNAVKCLPPANKPIPAEIAQCNSYLGAELRSLRHDAAILALGTIAHLAVLRALSLRPAHYGFSHGAEHALPDGRRLFDSYHCSRYNTQTRRLTEVMFHGVFARIVDYSAVLPASPRKF